MTSLVQLEKVTKWFGDTTAMKEVSVAAGPGTIIGLVGANGCGKSTLLRHIVGLYLPDQGRCQTLGCNAADWLILLLIVTGKKKSNNIPG